MTQPGTMPPESATIAIDYATARATTPQAVAAGELAEQLLRDFRERVGHRRFEMWRAGNTLLQIAGAQVKVLVASPFLLSWTQKQFRDELAQSALQLLGPAAEITFEVDSQLILRADPAHPAPDPASVAISAVSGGSATTAQRSASSTPDRGRPDARDTARETTARVLGNSVLSPRQESSTATAIPTTTRKPAAEQPVSGITRVRQLASLAEFESSPANAITLSAAQQFALGAGLPISPLYLHGGVGTGKTHLLEGICRELRQSRPQARALLITAEGFTNYFTQALAERTLPGFRQKFRHVDVLLVDDVNFFAGKRAVQEEFLHTFAELVQHGGQLVLTGDKHPRLTKLSPELTTRMSSGLICRIEPPDPTARLRIVQRKLEKHPADIAPEALEYVARRFPQSVRELEGALNCLRTLASMTGKRVTMSAAQRVLAELERDCLKIVRLADVERVVCDLFRIRPAELRSDTRARTISQPRMLAMFLARKHTQAAYTEIGQHFGGRNHSTVISAERKVSDWLASGATLRVAQQEWSVSDVVSSLEQQLLAG